MAEYIEREAAIDAIMKVYVRTAGYKARERVLRQKKQYTDCRSPMSRPCGADTGLRKMAVKSARSAVKNTSGTSTEPHTAMCAVRKWR